VTPTKPLGAATATEDATPSANTNSVATEPAGRPLENSHVRGGDPGAEKDGAPT
jgi:hypothetical protein